MPRNPPQRFLRSHPTTPDKADVLITSQRLIQMRSEDVGLAFDRLAPQLQSHDEILRPELAPAAERGRVPLGMRYLLSPNEGEGYWDIFRPSPHLLVIVIDAIHRDDTWTPVEETGCFKLRLLLSGRIMRPRGTPLLHGPQAQIHVLPQQTPAGYFIAGGSRARMVIVEGRVPLLTEVLRLEPAGVPAPLRGLFEPGCSDPERKVTLGPGLFRAAQDILESRYELPPDLRGAYLQAKAMEIVCQMIGAFSTREAVRKLSIRLSTRDLNRIYEARDYLSQHYVTPPSLAELSRMVGINQTKLKAGFKQAIGMTVYHYVIERRMECAAELLLAGSHSVSEVAYMVGYEYPANFTYAFKKRFGHLPRGLRSKG